MVALACKVQVSLWTNVNVFLHPAAVGSLSIKHQTGIVRESKTSFLFVLDKEQVSIINKLFDMNKLQDFIRNYFDGSATKRLSSSIVFSV